MLFWRRELFFEGQGSVFASIVAIPKENVEDHPSRVVSRATEFRSAVHSQRVLFVSARVISVNMASKN